MNLGEKMVDRRVLRAEMWDLVWFIAMKMWFHGGLGFFTVAFEGN